ncbi:SusD/RagB family nutrient-binding outer membrane lipoprotein [Mucilaginibacter conchicola]|uniref:SusD/RagB family nutrient-binding outer membrane lipoprotein n=1 Tax=Mucilaginibacter conchicola TaxID=2303333 RepID=A0A372NS36_9SPHI|nr:SusD/RagB family nutrient-binding outer membrane lipoprotein [Mucilaginibacter conchicola]RFZ91952.1 SusD/RagB family nutrient-binding outer membrane lipoprotein [Mucilaginibacter conchicola]
MKKYLNKILVVFVAAAVLTSCKKITDDMNVSPNQPDVLSTGYGINSAIQWLGGTGGGNATTNINSAAGELYSQYLSETFYTNESRFALAQYDYQGYYTGPIADLNQVIRFNTDPALKDAITTLNFGSNANQIAVARILRAFVFLTVTDRWGDVPYSEALKGLSELTPKFDTQKDIYTALFKELTEAQAQFDNGGLYEDILFQGDVTKWKHWANSLRAVMALRLSKIDETTGSAEFKKAVADGLMTSNQDNATYKYLGELNNENPWFGNYRNRYDYGPSALVINTLKANADPRLEVYADTTSTGTIVGLPYGTSGSALGAFKIGNRKVKGNISQIGPAYASQSSPTVWTSYAQILFAQAEAAHLGWITGGDGQAATLYNKGITASLAQNGITEAATATYLAKPGVVFDATKAEEQIITQKWLANYLGNGWESWAEYRRTGFPVLLDPVPTALNADKHIPRRQQYPQSENDLNKTNYNEVVARQGPDALNTHIWWDK